ncbi:branched-chain amino acid ABC transporter permease [bacterium]|nr:MAG: branched-chain amino acid ABC transporter permease [bacterium]
MAALLGSILATPSLLPNEYYLTVLIVGGLNTILAIGLNLLLGYAGQISLGHAAFFGLAAYTSGILTATHGWPVAAGAVAAIFLVGIIAYVIGKPTLKLKGHYLAMGTLGFGIIIYIILNEATAITGGPSGFTGIPKFELFGFTPTRDIEFYYLIWATVFAVFVISQNIMHSRQGRALRAIHTSEAGASVLGINVAGYKLFVFVLSAVFAAIAGVLYAHYITFVSPGSFGFSFSVLLVTMVVLGGMASLWGSIFGALFLTALPEFLRAVENYDIIIYGAILVLCMIFLPGGLAEALHRLAKLAGSLYGLVFGKNGGGARK